MPKIDFSEWFEGPDTEVTPFDYLCTCEGKKGNEEHVLTITEGQANVIHKPCGMEITDYPEDITLEEEIPVNVRWLPDGCDPPGGWHGVDGRCDCGYYLEITLGV